MNTRDLVVFDFETGDKDVSLFERGEGCEPIQIAAVVINARRLTIIGEFESLMRPLQPELLKDEALAVNKKDRAVLATAPHPEMVWKDFSNFVNKYNFKKTPFFSPIPCGFNIRNFDMPIVNRLCQLYGPLDKKTGKQGLFSSFNMWDLADDVFRWFENSKALPNSKLDTLRDYFGISKEGAHDALVDCRTTAEIIIKYMRLYRYMMPKVKFEGCMREQEV